MVKNLPSKAGVTGDMGWNPGSGRCPGVGNGQPIRVFLPGKTRGQEPGKLQSTQVAGAANSGT